MRQINAILMLLGLVLLSLAPSQTLTRSSAEGEACPELVRNALATTGNLCQKVGRNQACYGHFALEAQPQPSITSLKFDQEGDVVDVARLHSLRLSAMDSASNAWGIALMRLQASLPDSLPGKNITMLLFGDVEVSNQMNIASTSLEANINAASNVNLRESPSLDSRVIGNAAPGEIVAANGRLADDSWIRVLLPDNRGSGWVAGWLLTSAGDLQTLDVVEPSSRYYGPMQAFTFKSGQNDSMCAEAPDSGLLVQTPEGVAEVTLLVNEVNVQIGSTVYFQAQPGGDMTVSVVEGAARVTTAGQTYTAIAGSQLTVPVDENLTPSGPPTYPTAYAIGDVQALPVSSLERPITIHSPANPEDIAAANRPVELSVTEELSDENGDGVLSSVEGDTPSSTEAAPAQAALSSEEVNDKITICHKGNTITISSDALPAHLAHGDTIGPCP